MGKRGWIAGVIACLVLGCLAGCGDGPEKKVLGVWKSQHPSPLTGLPEFLVIEASKLGQGGGDTIDIAIDSKDGKAVIRRAGMDTPLFIVSVAEDGKSITVNNAAGGGSSTYLASSRDELQDTLFPSPEKIYGFWSRTNEESGLVYHSVIELGKGFLRYNGMEEEIDIQSANGQYRFAGSQLFPLALTLDGDTLSGGNSLSGTIVLHRSNKAEAEKYLAERSTIAERFDGVWLEVDTTGRRGRFTPPEILEIENGTVVQYADGERTEAKGGLAVRDTGVFVNVGWKSRYARLDGERLVLSDRSGPFSGNEVFRKITAGQRDEALNQSVNAADMVVGVWKRQGGRTLPDHPYLKITEDSLELSGKEIAVTLAGKNDTVVATGEKGEYRLRPTNDGTLEVGGIGRYEDGVYDPSTPEEMQEAIEASLALADQIAGYWRSARGDAQTKNYLPLHITRGTVTYEGTSRNVRVVPGRADSFTLMEGETEFAVVRLQQDGTVLFEPAKGQRRVFVKASQPEYEAILAGTAILPSAYYGYWMTEPNRRGISATLFIRPDLIIRNGYQEAIRVTPDNDKVILSRADLPAYRIASLSLLGSSNDKLNASFFSGSNRYNRVSKEVFEEAYKKNFFLPDLVWGAWITENLNRRTNPKAAVVFTQGQAGGWPVQLSSFGLDGNGGAQEPPVGAVFDIQGDGRVYLRGGEGLDKRLGYIDVIDRNTIKFESSHYSKRGEFTRATNEMLQELTATP